jgi:mRNA interferase RelE/StbE
MNTDFKTSFLNDLKKVKDERLLPKVEQAILDVENAEKIKDIPEIRKLKGSKKGICYRIKINNYRIGVTIENNLVTFVVFKPRKDVYKFFP